MRLGGWILGIAMLAPVLTGCGKFADKFSRINGDVTRVHFDNGRRGELHGESVLNGGLMVYFLDVGDMDRGRIFGVAHEDLILQKSFLIPNGQYKVYAYGWAGTNPLEGQVKCGWGDNGQIIALTGATTTVNLLLSASNCSFGGNSDFGVPNAADDPSNTNFDVMSVQLCDGSGYPCTVSTTGTWYVKAEMMAGVAVPPNQVQLQPEFALSSGCSSGGTGTISTPFRIPVGGTGFTPPIRLHVYGNSACSGAASGTYDFMDGIKKFQSVSTGSSYHLEIPATSTYFYLRVNKYF